MKNFVNKFLVFTLTFSLIIICKLSLNLLGFGSLVKALKKIRINIISINKILYVLRSIEIICSIIPNISCLIRASVLKIIYSNTENLEIIIGISSGESELFESHAWVIYNNKVILNDDFKIDSYKVIYTI